MPAFPYHQWGTVLEDDNDFNLLFLSQTFFFFATLFLVAPSLFMLMEIEN
jgi:hypothetical protein